MNDTPPPVRAVVCPWCCTPFTPPKVTHGAAQKFCCAAHRAAFWKAARRWVARAIMSGLLTYDAVRAGGAAVYGLGAGDKSVADVAP